MISTSRDNTPDIRRPPRRNARRRPDHLLMAVTIAKMFISMTGKTQWPTLHASHNRTACGRHQSDRPRLIVKTP